MEKKSFKNTHYKGKRGASSEDILLRGTLYVYINSGRYFFGRQHLIRGVLMNFQADEGHYGKRNNISRWKFMLISISD